MHSPMQQLQFQQPVQVPPFATGYSTVQLHQQQGGVAAAGQGVTGAKRKKKKSNARGNPTQQPLANQQQPVMVSSGQGQSGQFQGQGYQLQGAQQQMFAPTFQGQQGYPLNPVANVDVVPVGGTVGVVDVSAVGLVHEEAGGMVKVHGRSHAWFW